MLYEIGDTTLSSQHTAIKMWEVTVESGSRCLREHRHINFEIALVLEGTGTYHTSRGLKTIEPGNLFIYTSNDPHCIIDVANGGLKLLNLHFSSRVLESIPRLEEQYPFLFYNHAMDCKIDSDPVISQMLFRIRYEFTQMYEGFSCVITGLIGEILIHLIRNHGFYPTASASSAAMQKLAKGIAYINRHYWEDISLEQIAEQSSITPNYFSALFRECLNMKLWDYVTAKRIERAKRLLHRESSSLTVLDIATQCGFNNTANFNRAFRQHTGITPKQYRENRYENMI